MVGYAQNLLLNGDFESGNSGFFSDYNYNSDLNGEGRYVVGYNPQSHHSHTGGNFGDHTTGSGLMLIANGQTSSVQTIWRETISVEPGEHYYFQYFAASWGAAPGQNIDASPSLLQLRVGGHNVGVPLTLPSLVGDWVSFNASWTATQTEDILEIIDLNTTFGGNDFVLDDLSVIAVPEPTNVTLTVLAVCLYWSLKVRKNYSEQN